MRPRREAEAATAIIAIGGLIGGGILLWWLLTQWPQSQVTGRPIAVYTIR